MKKVERLQVTEFVFTTDSEVDPSKKAGLVENALKTKKLSITENTKKAMTSVLPMGSDSENYDRLNSTTDSDSSICDAKIKGKNKYTSRKNKKSNSKKRNLSAIDNLPLPKKNKTDERSSSTPILPEVATSSSTIIRRHIDTESKNSFTSEQSVSKNDGPSAEAESKRINDVEVIRKPEDNKTVESNIHKKKRAQGMTVIKAFLFSFIT